MDIPFQHFLCQKCGACCRIPGHVRLREEAIDAMAAHLEMSVTAFTDTVTALAADRRGLVLRDHPDGACMLLDAHGRCRVHPVKPTQCRSFPFAWMNRDSAAICPALQALASDAPSLLQYGQEQIHAHTFEQPQPVVNPADTGSHRAPAP